MTTKSKRVAETEKSTDVKRIRIPCEDFEVSEPADVQRILNSLKHSDPVLQLHLTKNHDSPDITPSSENLLESLIFPLSTLDFKTSCFRKKAVYVCSNRIDRASDISLNYMFGLDSKQIFEETSSDNVFFWIPSNDKGYSSNTSNHHSLQSIAIHDPDTANVLHSHSKYASYCRAPPELEQQLVSNMLRSVGLGLGQYDPRGEILHSFQIDDFHCIRSLHVNEYPLRSQYVSFAKSLKERKQLLLAEVRSKLSLERRAI